VTQFVVERIQKGWWQYCSTIILSITGQKWIFSISACRWTTSDSIDSPGHWRQQRMLTWWTTVSTLVRWYPTVEEVLSEAKVLRRTFFFKEGEASVAFPSLKKNIYMELLYIRTDARDPQHLGLYAIIPVLVYACETWTVTKTL